MNNIPKKIFAEMEALLIKADAAYKKEIEERYGLDTSHWTVIPLLKVGLDT